MKINIPKSQLSEPIQIFVNANTPMFLFKKLKQNLQVIELGKKYATREIVESFANRTTSKRTVEDQTIAYMLLVALSCKPFLEMSQALPTLDLSDLEWGDYIRNAIIQTSQLADVINVKVPVRTNPPQYSVESENTQKSVLIIP
jgi:hypothetical protein